MVFGQNLLIFECIQVKIGQHFVYKVKNGSKYCYYSVNRLSNLRFYSYSSPFWPAGRTTLHAQSRECSPRAAWSINPARGPSPFAWNRDACGPRADEMMMDTPVTDKSHKSTEREKKHAQRNTQLSLLIVVTSPHTHTPCYTHTHTHTYTHTHTHTHTHIQCVPVSVSIGSIKQSYLTDPLIVLRFLDTLNWDNVIKCI